MPHPPPGNFQIWGDRDACEKSMRSSDQTPQRWPTKAATAKPTPAPSSHWIPIPPRLASAREPLGFASTVLSDPAQLVDAFRRIAASVAGCWPVNSAVSAIGEENHTPMPYS